MEPINRPQIKPVDSPLVLQNSRDEGKHPDLSIYPQMPTQPHFFDKATSMLVKQNVLNSALKVVKREEPIPNLSREVILNIVDELFKTRVLKTSGEPSYPIYFTIIDLCRHVGDSFREIELVGGTVFWVLLPMLKKILISLGLNDPDSFFSDELLREWSVKPSDLDIRFHLSKSLTEQEMKQISNRIKNWFASKLPEGTPGNKFDFFHFNGLVKLRAKYGKNSQYAMLAVGDRQGNNVDMLCILNLRRMSFLTQDSLSYFVKQIIQDFFSKNIPFEQFRKEIETEKYLPIIQPKHSQGDPCQPIIDRLLGILRADEPKGINHIGWCLIMSYFTKGKRSLDRDLERILFTSLKYWAEKKHRVLGEEIVLIIRKVLANHHKQGDSAAAFAITLNACLYLQRHDSSLVPYVWIGMKDLFEASELVFIQKIHRQMNEGGIEEVSALLQLEALFSIGIQNTELAWITHEGQVAVQRRVHHSFLLFSFEPIRALEVVKKTKNLETLEEIRCLMKHATFNPGCVDRNIVKKIAYELLGKDQLELQSLGCLLIHGCEQNIVVSGNIIDLTIRLASLNKEDLSYFAFKLWEKLETNRSQKALFFHSIYKSRPDIGCKLLAEATPIGELQLKAFQMVYEVVTACEKKEKFRKQVLRSAGILIQKYSGKVNQTNSDILKALYKDFTKPEDVFRASKLLVVADLLTSSEEIKEYTSRINSGMDITRFFAQCLIKIVSNTDYTKKSLMFLLKAFFLQQEYTLEENWNEYITLIHQVVSQLPKSVMEELSLGCSCVYKGCRALDKINQERVYDLWQAYRPLLSFSKDSLTKLILIHFKSKEDFFFVSALLEVYLFFTEDSALFPWTSFKCLQEACEKSNDVVNEFLNELHPKPKKVEDKEALISTLEVFAKMKSKDAKALGCALRIVSENEVNTIKGSPKYWAMAIAEKGFVEQARDLWKLLSTSPQEILKFIDCCSKTDPKFAMEFLIQEKKRLETLFLSGIIKICAHCRNRKELVPLIVSKLFPLVPKHKQLSLDFLEILEWTFRELLSQGVQDTNLKIIHLMNPVHYKLEDKSKLIIIWKNCWKEVLKYPGFASLWKEMEKEEIPLEIEEHEAESFLNLYKNIEWTPSFFWTQFVKKAALIHNPKLHSSVLDFLFGTFFKKNQDLLLFCECLRIFKNSSSLLNCLLEYLSRNQAIEICERALECLLLRVNEEEKLYFDLFEAFTFMPFLHSEQEQFEAHVKKIYFFLNKWKRESSRKKLFLLYLNESVDKRKRPDLEIVKSTFDHLLKVNVGEALHFMHNSGSTIFTSFPELYSLCYKKLINDVSCNQNEDERWRLLTLIKHNFLDHFKNYADAFPVSENLIQEMLKFFDQKKIQATCDYIAVLLDLGLFKFQEKILSRFLIKIISNLKKCSLDGASFKEISLKIFNVSFHGNVAGFSDCTFYSEWLNYLCEINSFSEALNFIKSINLIKQVDENDYNKMCFDLAKRFFLQTDASFLELFIRRQLYNEFNELFKNGYKKFTDVDLINKTLGKAELALNHFVKMENLTNFYPILEVCLTNCSEMSTRFLKSYCFPWIIKCIENSTKINRKIIELLNASSLIKDIADEPSKSELENFLITICSEIYINEKKLSSGSMFKFRLFIDHLWPKISNETRSNIGAIIAQYFMNLMRNNNLKFLEMAMDTSEGSWLTDRDYVEITAEFVSKKLEQGEVISASRNLLAVLTEIEISVIVDSEKYITSYLQTLETLLAQSVEVPFAARLISRAFDLIAADIFLEARPIAKKWTQSIIDRFVSILYTFEPSESYIQDHFYDQERDLKRTSCKTFKEMMDDLQDKGIAALRKESDEMNALMSLSKFEFLSSENLKTLLYYLKVALHKKRFDIINLCHTILFKKFKQEQRWEESKEDIYLIWLYGLQLYTFHLPDEGKYLLEEFTEFCNIFPRVTSSSIAEFARYSLHYLIAIFKNENEVEKYVECSSEIQLLVEDFFSSSNSFEDQTLSSNYILADLAVSMAMVYACESESQASKLSCSFLKKVQFEFLRGSSHPTLLDVINRLICWGSASADIELHKDVSCILKNVRKQLDLQQFDPSVIIQSVINSRNFSLIHEFCLLFDELADKKKYILEEPFCLRLYELLELAVAPNFATSFKGIVKILGLISCYIKIDSKFEEILKLFFNEVCSILSKKHYGKLFYLRFLTFCSGFLVIIDKNKKLRNTVLEMTSSVLKTCFSEKPELLGELLKLDLLAHVGSAFELLDKVKCTEKEEDKLRLAQTFLRSVLISFNFEDDRLSQLCDSKESNDKDFEYGVFKAKLFIEIINNWNVKTDYKQYELLYLEMEKLLMNINTLPHYKKFDIGLYNILLDLFKTFPIKIGGLSRFNDRYKLTLQIACRDFLNKKRTNPK